jgi:hypothetical protein
MTVYDMSINDNKVTEFIASSSHGPLVIEDLKHLITEIRVCSPDGGKTVARINFDTRSVTLFDPTLWFEWAER